MASAGSDDPDDEFEVPDVVVVPITDELDLHTYRPSDVGSLVPEYLEEAPAIGLSEVRIIHGKGIGALRRTVHAALERCPLVESFQQADRGGWGATLVKLRRPARP